LRVLRERLREPPVNLFIFPETADERPANPKTFCANPKDEIPLESFKKHSFPQGTQKSGLTALPRARR
jgi:hypothetical protein